MTHLPIPGETALNHSEKLTQLIRQEIAANGAPISFARYMELALYAPGLGYYSAGSHKLGKEGDFITAPLISPLFSQCLARQCAEILREPGLDEILELGAGTGNLACDLLLELEKQNRLPERYLILEISAELQERQRTLLASRCPQLLSRIHWLCELPAKISGIILANEVLDAMPVHCFQIKENQILERCVGFTENRLTWQTQTPTTPALTAAVQKIQENCFLPEGYESEINLLHADWIKTLASVITRGVMLFLDYGLGEREYYHPERSAGTLKCFYQHHHHNDPFVMPGLQDITAHVNFTTIAEAAVDSDLTVSGYTTQASFLLACGLMEFAEMHPLSELEIYRQSQAIKLLTLPSEMGEIVKVIALQKNTDIPLIGFTLFDRRHDL